MENRNGERRTEYRQGTKENGKLKTENGKLEAGNVKQILENGV